MCFFFWGYQSSIKNVNANSSFPDYVGIFQKNRIYSKYIRSEEVWWRIRREIVNESRIFTRNHSSRFKTIYFFIEALPRKSFPLTGAKKISYEDRLIYFSVLWNKTSVSQQFSLYIKNLSFIHLQHTFTRKIRWY